MKYMQKLNKANTRDYTYEYFKNRLENKEIRTNLQEFIDDIQKNRLINKELNIVSIRKILQRV
jgi:hypothetical protein